MFLIWGKIDFNQGCQFQNKDDDANGQEGRSAQSNEKSSEEKEGAELTRRKRETSKSRSRSGRDELTTMTHKNFPQNLSFDISCSGDIW